MHSDDPVGSQFKRACTDFSNLVELPKSATPKDIQAIYVHASVWNKFPGEKVTAFHLVG